MLHFREPTPIRCFNPFSPKLYNANDIQTTFTYSTTGNKMPLITKTLIPKERFQEISQGVIK